MAESRRQSPRQQSTGAQRAPRQASLKDALAATHEHSVPVLPAVPSGAPDPDPSRRGSPRSYGESAMDERHAAEGAPPRKGRSGAPRGKRSKQVPQAKETETARILLARTDMAEAGTALAPAPLPALSPLPDRRRDIAQEVVDEPTTALSVRGPGSDTGARLPAVRRVEGGRALVVAGPPESQAILIRGARRQPRPRTGRMVPRRLGPRPFAVQFLIAMVMAMLLFGAMALATPLGQDSFFGTAIQAYANTVPWIPTPTPTPRPTATPVPLVAGYDPPHKSDPGQTVIVNEIKAVFGSYATGALNISRCESGYDPNARNPFPVGNSHAMGVFQILFPSTWAGTSYWRYSPYDYDKNIHAAWEIFKRDGFSWREWECKPF